MIEEFNLEILKQPLYMQALKCNGDEFKLEDLCNHYSVQVAKNTNSWNSIAGYTESQMFSAWYALFHRTDPGDLVIANRSSLELPYDIMDAYLLRAICAGNLILQMCLPYVEPTKYNLMLQLSSIPEWGSLLYTYVISLTDYSRGMPLMTEVLKCLKESTHGNYYFKSILEYHEVALMGLTFYLINKLEV